MHTEDNPDFCLKSYSFDLPDDRIAQHPANERCGSRLMVLRRDGDYCEQAMFADLVRYLPEGCLLLANNSRVAPARLRAKGPGGGAVECLLLTPLPLLEPDPPRQHCSAATESEERTSGGESGRREAVAEALLRPARKVPQGEGLIIAPDLALRVLERGAYGRCRILLSWRGDLRALLERYGELPLPPYIRRQRGTANATCAPACSGGGRIENAPASAKLAPLAGEGGTDAERYQTIYARQDKTGSVAAPTAGLHFTRSLRAELERSGREWAEATLYVGYGTFSPVRCSDIRQHRMHGEYAELPRQTLEAVRKARAEGRPVIAVGTTSARLLEGVCELRPDLFERSQSGVGRQGAPEKGDLASPAFAGWIRSFLYPGRPIRVIDGLITNFHLPGSSLLMLVSAFAGRQRVLDAYHEAIAAGFRFFSYGDAMLIL